MDRLKIGEVSDETGVSKQTLRYYEKEGLLEEPHRDPISRYRKYEPETVHRVRFIKNAQELGFTLSEINELLSILSGQKEVPNKFARKLRYKKEQVEEKIEKLVAIKDVLGELLEECPEEGSVQDCPCVEEIAPEGNLEEFLKPFQSRR